MKALFYLAGVSVDFDRGLLRYSEEWWAREVVDHPTRDDCPDPECMICSWRDCPDHEPLHYDTDGPCPSCEDGVADAG